TEPDMPLNFQQIMLETALEDSERLRKLVQDFLTLSRLESGAARWFVEPISFQECLDLVLSRYASSPDQPHIGLDIPSELPLVLVDGDGLIEVLGKLLDNACKFTPADGKITIRAQLFGEAGYDRAKPTLEVVIADTGRGIEPNRLEAVFDRFSQEEGFLQRTVGGTGLGLAICRRTIEAMDGTIWAESMGKNLGSEFHFTVGVA
ncbi:MAG: histidine kinase, partial [Phormidesmis sp. CAN_BIN44]|nr:histidine kinase [Phormidesmis sp. CAN_BIN44]